MTEPYLVRLFCLCLAAFFLIHLAAGLAVARLSGAAIRLASRMRARHAAAFLLVVRLLPPIAAMVAVGGFCAPSYLWLEPRATAEEIGWGCLAAAVCGAAVCAMALVRSVRALWSVSRSMGRWRRTAREVRVDGHADTVLEIAGSAPFLALAGIFRPRLVITRPVLDSLSPEELLAALSHERAHRESRDNLKRLLFLLSPDPLPRWPGLRRIERAWAGFAEWAADDRAVAGDASSSVTLAAALVRVARLGSAPPASSPLVTSLLADTRELAARVERLLDAREATDSGRWFAVWCPLATALLATGLALLVCRPEALFWVHGTMERLAH